MGVIGAGLEGVEEGTVRDLRVSTRVTMAGAIGGVEVVTAIDRGVGVTTSRVTRVGMRMLGGVAAGGGEEEGIRIVHIAREAKDTHRTDMK